MVAARGSSSAANRGERGHQRAAARHPLRALAMQAIAVASLVALLGAATAFQAPSALSLRSVTALGPRGNLALRPARAGFPLGGARGGRPGAVPGLVMMAKKKMNAAQLAALEALEKFEQAAMDVPGAVAVPEPVVMKKEKKKKEKKPKAKGEASQEASIELSEEEEAELEEEGMAIDPKGKKGKKKGGKKGGSDDSEDAEFEPTVVAKRREVVAASPAPVEEFSVAEEEDLDALLGGGKGKKGKKGNKAAGAVDDFEAGSDFSADDLFEDGDSGRPGKGKKAGKKLSKKQAAKAGLDYEEDEPAPAQADGAEVETLEAKIKKSRPPPKVRIDSGVQPGYVNVRLEDISVIFRNQEVCSGCTWGVQTGDRAGLVGANGGGKTTQLRIMYGELEPTAGEVVKSSADLRISFLRQEFVDDLVLSRTLKEELQSVFIEEAQVMEELDNFDKVLEGCKNDPDEMQRQLDRMQDLQRRADSMQVSMLQSKVEKIMDLMGFTPEEGDALVASFSGGWKMRIGLGKILLTEPNLLLLDEPTNHLDLESIEWMEKFLINQKIPMVIVSHDREFLDRVCNKIVDVEGGKTQSYDGNYSRFLKLKQERREAWESAYNAQMKKVKAEKDWINRFKSGAQAAQAASRQKKLDKKMASDEWVQKPPTPGKPLRFRFPPAPRVGDGYAIMTATGIGHGYEQEGRESVLFSDVQLNVEKGERVAFLGPNGCGKSTFLRLVVGKEKPNEGQITLGGNNIAVSYYEQNQADVLDLEKTVLETMKDAADGRMEYEEIRALLGQFLFKGDSVDKKLEHLSGGEKARVALCTMMMSPANLLVLDEPTNHLDIPAKEMLEEALQHYDGTLLVISHDRYFVSQVANVIAAFEDKQIVRYNGDYKFYMDKNEEWRDKVESRYVDGLEGIRELPEITLDETIVKKKKNFGGSGVTAGKKDKGVKNAKRQGDM